MKMTTNCKGDAKVAHLPISAKEKKVGKSNLTIKIFSNIILPTSQKNRENNEVSRKKRNRVNN